VLQAGQLAVGASLSVNSSSSSSSIIYSSSSKGGGCGSGSIGYSGASVVLW
jgi:hypothetical protein